MTKLLTADLKALTTLPSSEEMDKLIDKYYQLEYEKNKCKAADGIKDKERKEFIKVLQITQKAIKDYKDEKGASLDEELQKQLKAAVIGFYYFEHIQYYYGTTAKAKGKVTATHMPVMLGMETVEEINKINPDDWSELFSLFSSFVKILTIDNKTQKLTNHPFAILKTKTNEDILTAFSNKAQEFRQKHMAMIKKNSNKPKGFLGYFWSSPDKKQEPHPSLKFVEEQSPTNEVYQEQAKVEEEKQGEIDKAEADQHDGVNDESQNVKEEDEVTPVFSA